MHSVLILGDVRTHIFKSKPKKDKSAAESGTIYGGAFMMAKAVGHAIDALSECDTVPEVFGLSSDVPPKDFLGTEFRYWELVESVTDLVGNGSDGIVDEDTSKKCFRLQLKSQRKLLQLDSIELPSVPNEITRALGAFDKAKVRKMKEEDDRPSGFFEDSYRNSSDKMPWCPDLIVFDDLAGVFRTVRLEETLEQVDRSAENVKRSEIDDKVPSCQFTPGLNGKELSDVTVRGIGRRLLHAARAIRLRAEVTLEPVIICSVAGALPELTCAPGKKPGIWECLAHHEELRSRTVVLLDVEDLRQHQKLGISSGLSWERTAQETIFELRRSKTLRQFLAFGVVIVRFGGVGALQISRQPSGWSYRLFFDPHQADRDFTDSNPNNHVLGYSSIFTASLVGELTRICNVRGEKPLLHDLADAISHEIPRAITRCQHLFKQGYGDPSDAEKAIAEIESRLDFKDLFENPIDAPRISQVEVPEQRMRNWSILSQTAQGSMGRVARDIVMWGVDGALNRFIPSSRTVKQVLARECWYIVQNLTFEVLYQALGLPAAKKKLVEMLKPIRDLTLANTVRLPSNLHHRCLTDVLNAEGEWSSVVEFLFDEVRKLVANGENIADQDRFAAGSGIEAWFDEQLSLPCVGYSYMNERHDLFAAPVVRYGEKYTVVDRGEIEGVRAVHKLIEAYLDLIKDEPSNKHQPLSIAVFGPPGSGKSTAVRSIVESLRSHPVKTEVLLPAFNLAEATNSDDLVRAFAKVTKATAENKVAMAFFDEFDARYEGEQWGWLKFFLSPMEDMEFRGTPVHNSIFVFAGGTSPTYEQFALLDRPTTDPQVQDFGKAKGPDFKSRLAGYLNVVGVNPSDSDDELYLVRRAIVIRSILSGIQNLSPNEEARIDTDMLRAILFVPTYHNGARSVRKMLEQCSQDPRRRLIKSSVPLIQQMNMLTNGKAFMDLLANVSSEEGLQDHVG